MTSEPAPQARRGGAAIAASPALGAASGRLATRTLATATEITAIEGEWRALERRAGPEATVFQSADWCLASIRRAAAGGPHPLVATAWQGGALVGLMPLAREREHGLAVVRWLGDPLTQYGDVLVDRAEPAAAAAVLAEARASAGADLMNLRKVRASAAIHRAGLPSPGADALADAAPAVAFHGLADMDAYWATRKSKFVRNIRRVRRRLEEMGPLGFTVLRSGPGAGEDVAATVREAIGFKDTWLAERGLMSRAALLDDPHRLLVDMAESGTETPLVVSRLGIGDVAAAIEVGFAWNGNYYAYLGAFNPAFASASPGLVQMAETLDWCIKAGLGRYDLFAPADEYKLHWTNAAEPVADHVVPLTVRGRAYAALYLKRLRPLMRRTYDGMPLEWRKRLGSIIKQG